MEPIATFPTLDEAESALDWIGVEFVEAGDGFEGELTEEDRDLLDDAIADSDAPVPVRDLAAALLARLDAGDGERTFRVDYQEPPVS